jgi:hypothetical protein
MCNEASATPVRGVQRGLPWARAGNGLRPARFDRAIGSGKAGEWRWFGKLAGIALLTLLPVTVCQAMYKCQQPDGGFSYQGEPCANDAQAQSFNARPWAKAPSNAAPANPASGANTLTPGQPVGDQNAQPAAQDLPGDEADYVGPPDSFGQDPRFVQWTGLPLLVLILYSYIRWMFSVSARAGRNGRSAVFWFLLAWWLTPLIADGLLTQMDGQDEITGVSWRFIAIVVLFNAVMVYTALDAARENRAFRQFGREAVLDRVGTYSIQTTEFRDPTGKTVGQPRQEAIVYPYFRTDDDRKIKASRPVPQNLAYKLINGGTVKVTYLSNNPWKVRFEGDNQEAMKGRGLIMLFLLDIGFLIFWLRRRGWAKAAA